MIITLIIILFIIYFSSNSGDLTNTSSHICGSWYLPIFLFRDGLSTLISMASLMVLVMLWVFPAHYAEIVQGHFMTCGVKMVMYRWWWLHVLPESFSKGPTHPIYIIGCKTRWVPSLPWHNSFATAWQLPSNISVLKAHTHRFVPAVGQSPSPISQV